MAPLTQMLVSSRLSKYIPLLLGIGLLFIATYLGLYLIDQIILGVKT